MTHVQSLVSPQNYFPACGMCSSNEDEEQNWIRNMGVCMLVIITGPYTFGPPCMLWQNYVNYCYLQHKFASI